MKLTYDIPQGLTDEVKWLKFFHTRSIKVLAITGIPGVIIARFIRSFRVLVVFLVVWFLFVAICTIPTMILMPASWWLNGGGEYLDQIVLKRYIRKKSRCLYIKGYNQADYEERERELGRVDSVKGESNGIFVR